eukprot:3516994-Amphidinium_carterae.1
MTGGQGTNSDGKRLGHSYMATNTPGIPALAALLDTWLVGGANSGSKCVKNATATKQRHAPLDRKADIAGCCVEMWEKLKLGHFDHRTVWLLVTP